MSYGENRQLAAFLIEQDWIAADKVVYFLEVSRSSDELLGDILLKNRLLNPEQAGKLEEFRKSLQMPAKSSKNRIPGYKIVSKLGTGGMGSVYKAVHLDSKRSVAIKVLSKQFSEDQEYVQRFLREARTMGELNHPNIVRAFESGKADGLFFLVMEFVDGISGYDWLQQEGHTEEELINLGGQMANAMVHYDQLKMVHRDIKPDNILISKQGESKLCDLGLAKRESYDTKITATGVTLGTPHYLSPEQARGETLDIRSDIYSLGATLFHMAAGREPYVAKNIIVIMQKHLYDPIPSVRDFKNHFSEGFDRIIQKMLAKEKRSRYQTPEELYQDFQTLLSGGQITPIESPAQKLNRRKKKSISAVREQDTETMNKLSMAGRAPQGYGVPMSWYIALISLILILVGLIIYFLIVA